MLFPERKAFFPKEAIMAYDIGSILLGAIAANADSGAMLPDGITAEMFGSSRDRAIFAAASELIREGMPPNTYASLIPRYGELLKQQATNRETKRAILEAAEGLKNGSPELVVPELLRKIAGYGNGKERQSFRLSRLDSIEAKAASWIVKGIIENESFCCMYGDSGTGKSFLAIEIAACIATGTLFYGVPVKRGPVVYLAGEGHSGLARRFKAWGIMRGVSLEGAPLYLSEGAVALIEPAAMGPVCNALEGLIKDIGNPSLVILDTWSRILGGDDSAPSDAAHGNSVQKHPRIEIHLRPRGRAADRKHRAGRRRH